MTSAERTTALSHLGRNIATITLGWQRAWTFVNRPRTCTLYTCRMGTEHVFIYNTKAAKVMI